MTSTAFQTSDEEKEKEEKEEEKEETDEAHFTTGL